MKNSDHNLLVVLKNEFMSESAIEQEVECLNGILMETCSPEQFCRAHELVMRNRITSKANKILIATRQEQLKAFYFLINKN